MANEIPDDIWAQAHSIVAAHRPTDPELKNFQPLCQLTLNDFNQLNVPPDQWQGGSNARNARIDELRTKHASDPFAIEQLDIFDPRSDYSREMRDLLKALHVNRQADVSEITERLNSLTPLHQQVIEKKANF